MPHTINPGTRLIEEGALLPKAARSESEASEASKRFQGVCYVTVSAQSRDIQESAPLFRAKDLPVRDCAGSA